LLRDAELPEHAAQSGRIEHASYHDRMDDPWTILRRAAADLSSGAAEIAREAAEAVRAVPPGRVLDAVALLVRGHPSMAPLWRLASDALSARVPTAGADAFLDRLAGDGRASDVVARALPDTVLAISYSSSIAAVIERRRPSRTICMRSDPGGEGERLAELVSPWTRAEVIDDDHGIESVPAEAVLTGADAVTPEAILNKVKTRALAEAAALKGVPCYAAAGRTKLVDRPLPVSAPFESVPIDLFVGIGLPEGLHSPPEAAAEARAAALHPALLPLLAELLGA
jgi:hypothetical protein